MGDPERTAGVIDAARWMHTSNLAVIDAEGFCNVFSRHKDVYNHQLRPLRFGVVVRQTKSNG